MRITNAEYYAGVLRLTTNSNEAFDLTIGFKPGDYELRSLEPKSTKANNYLWRLCDLIAQKTGETKEQVYRDNIRMVGHYKSLDVPPEDLDFWRTSWTRNGIGWFMDVIDYADEGKLTCFFYEGSSRYNRKEFSRLLDAVVQDAIAVGADVITDRERSLLLNEIKDNG